MITEAKPRRRLRYITDTLGQAWVIAGGFGGLAGVVVLTILEKLGTLAPIYAEFGRLLIVCSILFAASTRVFVKMEQAQRRLAKANADLHQDLHEKVERKRMLLYRLQANLRSIGFESFEYVGFVDSLEREVLRDILLLYDLSRVSMYVWDLTDNQKTPINLGTEPLAVVEDSGDAIIRVADKDVLRAEELVLAHNVLSTKHSRSTDYTDESGGQFLVGYLPIVDMDDLSRIWSVLVVYRLRHGQSDRSDFERELVDMQQVLRPELAIAFRRAYETELKTRDLQKAQEAIIHQHISALLKRDPSGRIYIDDEFPTPGEQMSYVHHIATKHSDLVDLAFESSSIDSSKVLMICQDNYSLCLVPLVNKDEVNQVVMSVERSSRPINDDKSRWKALSDLVKHLYCGTFDDLSSLHSRHAFYRRLDSLLAKADGLPEAALLLIEVGRKDQPSRREERELIRAASKVIEQWGSTLRDDLTMGSRLDATVFALLAPAETEDQAYSTGTAIREQMHRSLEELIPQLSVTVGIAIVQKAYLSNREEWLDAAYIALERAEATDGISLVEVEELFDGSPDDSSVGAP